LRKIDQSQGDRQKCIQKRKPSKGKPITQHRKKKKKGEEGKKGNAQLFSPVKKGQKKLNKNGIIILINNNHHFLFRSCMEHN
jgi:hypothetical protein